MKILKQSGENGTCTKKKQFMDIAGKIAQAGHTYTWEQVQGKWKTLNAAFTFVKGQRTTIVSLEVIIRIVHFKKSLRICFKATPQSNPLP